METHLSKKLNLIAILMKLDKACQLAKHYVNMPFEKLLALKMKMTNVCRFQFEALLFWVWLLLWAWFNAHRTALRPALGWHLLWWQLKSFKGQNHGRRGLACCSC